MTCNICGSRAVAWKGDVDQVRFFAGDNKTSQSFLLTKHLNCSVNISWAAADNQSAQSIMSCQSKDGWSGVDGANLTCGSESAITSTVMGVKVCPSSTHPSPSMGECLRISSVWTLY